MVTILVTMVTILGVPKIKVFWIKVYDVIISVYDITNKILSRDSNYIVDVVPKIDMIDQSLGTLAFLWDKKLS